MSTVTGWVFTALVLAIVAMVPIRLIVLAIFAAAVLPAALALLVLL